MRDARHRFIIVFGGERAMTLKRSMLWLLCIDCTVELQCRESLCGCHLAVDEVLRLYLDGDAVLAIAEA